MAIQMQDISGERWVSVFDEQAAQILGPASRIHQLRTEGKEREAEVCFAL